MTMCERTESFQQAVRHYFRQPGFSRFLASLRKKFEASQAKPRGTIRLTALTEEERLTLDGFYGTYTPKRIADAGSTSTSYSITRFEKLLLESRFALTIAELFQLLEGEAVLTRGEQQTAAEEAWRKLTDGEWTLLGQEKGNHPLHHGRLLDWLKALGEGTALGFRTLRQQFATEPTVAGDNLRNCVRALLAVIDRIPNAGVSEAQVSYISPVRLPVLAARITGDAHALDWKYPLGRLFWWGLVTVFREKNEVLLFAEDGLEVEKTELVADEDVDEGEGTDEDKGLSKGVAAYREEAVDEDDLALDPIHSSARSLSKALLIREGYRRGGVADDDMSSQVLLFAPGWNSAWEERVLTLRQVEKLSRDEFANGRRQTVYMVENPSVFAVLVDEVTNRCGSHQPVDVQVDLPVLICGNGQPSVAVIKLLELLLAPSSPSSYHQQLLLYSGDLDLAGLDIARNLERRFPHAFIPWRIDSDVFHRYKARGISMTQTECDRMARIALPWEESLPQAAAASGVKLHQELWMEELILDWLAAFSDHSAH